MIHWNQTWLPIKQAILATLSDLGWNGQRVSADKTNDFLHSVFGVLNEWSILERDISSFLICLQIAEVCKTWLKVICFQKSVRDFESAITTQLHVLFEVLTHGFVRRVGQVLNIVEKTLENISPFLKLFEFVLRWDPRSHFYFVFKIYIN